MFLPGEAGYGTERSYSEEISREIDCAVRDLTQAALATATSILTRARQVLERGARALLEKESLGESELDAIKEQLLGMSHTARSTAEAEV